MFEDKIRQELAKTPFSDQERRNLLKVVIGEVQRKPAGVKVTDDMGYNVIKGMIKSNLDLMSYLPVDGPKYDGCERENVILQSLLPNYLSEEEIYCHLGELDVKSCKSEGQAVGQAMKYFKENHLPVEGETVKKAVVSLRS